VYAQMHVGVRRICGDSHELALRIMYKLLLLFYRCNGVDRRWSGHEIYKLRKVGLVFVQAAQVHDLS
jgi:hypothetical protein